MGAVSFDLAASENRHRRWVLIAAGTLVIAGTMPVYGHHVLSPVAALPTLDHLGALCLQALQALFAPVHDVFHWTILAGLLYAGFDRLRAVRALRRSLGSLRRSTPRPGDVMWLAAERAGVRPRAVRIVPFLPNPAFTAGFFRPAIYVSHRLPQYLSFDEIVAVLAHERSHLDRRDPLRLTLLRALSCVLFWLPAFRRLADDWSDEAEILADDAAATSGGRLALASALLALAQWPNRRVPATLGLVSTDLLDRRIRRLVGEQPRARSHLTRLSLATAIAALALVWISGAVTFNVRALSGPGALSHCEHHDGSAFSHLFCRRAEAAPEARCPHDVPLATRSVS